MKALLSLSLLFTLISCTTPPKNQEASGDSVLVQQADATEQLPAAQNVESPTSVNNEFPTYSLELLSEDPREQEVSDGLEKLIETYQQQPYLTVTSSYSRKWTYDGEYDQVEANEEETETWLFDTAFRLRGYGRNYSREGEGNDYKSALYLFSSDSLIAVIAQWDQDGQIGMTYQKRLLASKCPECGTDIRKEAGAENAQIENLGAADLSVMSSDFFSLHSRAMSSIKEEWEKGFAEDKNMVVFVEYEKGVDEESAGTRYTVKYVVDKSVYEKYITKLDN